jgi:hypothetical protein
VLSEDASLDELKNDELHEGGLSVEVEGRRCGMKNRVIVGRECKTNELKKRAME